MASTGDAIGPALTAVAVHSGAMLVVAGIIAVAVYRYVGVEMLRKAWVNLDFVWVSAFILAGTVTFGLGAWSLLA
jgi:hypothetical protein